MSARLATATRGHGELDRRGDWQQSPLWQLAEVQLGQPSPAADDRAVSRDRAPQRGTHGRVTIADVGCAEGFVAAFLRRSFPRLSCTGMDIDLAALRRGRQLSPAFESQQADILHLPYRSKSVDLVLCLEVLEHLHQPQAALAEITRVSRRYCLLSVPHEPFFRLANLARGKSVSRLGDDIDHRQHWTRGGFAAFLSANGLHVRVFAGAPALAGGVGGGSGLSEVALLPHPGHLGGDTGARRTRESCRAAREAHPRHGHRWDARTRSSSWTTAALTAPAALQGARPGRQRVTPWSFAATSARLSPSRSASRSPAGEVIITMDGDLQDDPAEIPHFLAALEDADVVSGWKQDRQDPLDKTLPSRFFNLVTSALTGVPAERLQLRLQGLPPRGCPVAGPVRRAAPLYSGAGPRQGLPHRRGARAPSSRAAMDGRSTAGSASFAARSI